MLSQLDTHNGTFTITNNASGTRRTFCVKTVTNEDSGLHGKRILSMLTGSDNEDHYTGFAFVDESGVHCWRRFRDSQYDKYAFFLNHADAFEAVDEISVVMSGTCRMCNRKLTVPESIESGIGPVCAAK